MTPGGGRLRVDLEVLCVALGAYLERLQSVWTASASREHAAGADVGRIVAAVGVPPQPGAEAQRHVRALVAQSQAPDDPLARLCDALALTTGEELCVAAAWWADADPQFAILLGCAHDDGGRRYASAGLLRLVLEPFAVIAPATIDDAGVLVWGGALEPGAGAAGALRLTPTARLILDGVAPQALRPPVPAPARLAGTCTALAGHLEEGRGGIVLLQGTPGIGRRGVAVEAALRAGLVPIGPRRPAAELKLLARLRTAVPVVPAEAVAELGWTPEDGPLVAWGPPARRQWEAYVVALTPPRYEQRAQRWADVLTQAGLEAGQTAQLAPSLAARFAFTEADIEAIAGRAALDAAWNERPLDGPLVWEAARRQPQHVLERMAALVTPMFSLDDLVLAGETDAKLRELVAHVALQHVVLDEWGFRRRLPRGQGVAALFMGPSGTGKTTAAEALARELRQDLYRIDLSAVVSKYIGETEKNLASAFDEAERGSAVLFFDEADALFGKRTEIRDAHDRYANLEVNYLLQRVETFTGLVVLTSNRPSAIDEGFLRRLRFVIRFEAPDAVLRRRLWKRSFPGEARVGKLDWDVLAAAELAGGSIQSAALAAAYLAAGDGGVITEEHVAHALLREHQKLGKAWAGIRAGAPG
jgi:DNA polymerase III delta prime subunit